MVKAGVRLTFVVSGSVGFLASDLSSMRTSVITGLDPYATVQSLTITPTETVIISALGNWNYRATVILAMASDYGTLSDVKSIVAHAFYEATGTLPIVSGQGDPDPGDAPKPKSDGPSITGAIVFASIAIGLMAILGLKKL